MAQRSPEFRFGMVLYGGVSLAVYIYGVVVEAQRLLRAAEELNRAGRSREDLKLSPYARALRAADISDVKIDLLSGTSAGGINGILLAKALARCSDVEKTKDLWLDGGDIEQLLQPPSVANPHSLLQSRAFEAQLKRGMGRLDEAERGVEPPAILDLFVSSTHLSGGRRQFVDSLGDSIETRQHRYVFQRKLRTPQSGPEGRPQGYEADEFRSQDNPTLVKLARATSAFPFAFEPVEITEQDRLLPAGEGGGWFADGGILNNKPFTEAVETIVTRSSDRPVRRWLFSIDPDPDAAPGGGEEDRAMPPFDQVVVRSIATIPRYQSIVRDLVDLDQHNEKVAAAERTICEIEEDLAGTGRRRLKRGLGPGVDAAYESMRRQAWGSEVADRLMEGTVVDGPAGLEAGGVRSAYRLVAEASFPGEREDGALHRRRLYYLIKLIGMSVDRDIRADEAKELLWAEYEEISSLLWRTLTRDCPQLGPGNQISAASEIAYNRLQTLQEALPRAIKASSRRIERTLFGVRISIAPHPSPLEGREGVELSSVRRSPVSVSLVDAARHFRPRDAMLLGPDVYGGLRQRDRIEHGQISPAGGRHTTVRAEDKLAGTTLGHFGGFLDRGWRRNDLMWGRLDGAEALIRGVLKDGDPDAAGPLLDEIQSAIVRAERPELLTETGDWKADLRRYAAGDVSEGQLNGRRLVTLSLRVAGIVRKMLRTAEREGAGGGAGGRVRGFVLRALANAIGFLLALVYLPATALFAKGRLVRRLLVFAALLPFVWGVLTLVVAIIGAIPFDAVALPAFAAIAVYPLFLLVYWILATVALKLGHLVPRLRRRDRR